MRNWINLCETKHYVGSCVDSFDEDGDCIIDDLPWSTVSDLGHADENAQDIGSVTFLQNVSLPNEIAADTSGHEIQYLEYDGVYMLYDVDADVHYFFT